MNNILDLKNYNSWVYDFKGLFELLEYDDVLKNKISRDEFIDKSSMHVKKLIKNKYDYIVYYHGSATHDINLYLSKGILTSSVEDRIKYARHLFPINNYPELIDSVFNEKKNIYLKDKEYLPQNEGKIYFNIDNSFFEEPSQQHYLCYGGETLGIFVGLLGERYKNELKEKLTPVIFKCIIPVKYLENDFDDIIKDIIDKFFEIIEFPKYKFSYGSSTPYICTNIRPEWIIGCEFPNYENINCV